MIRKINITLAVAFVILFAVKGLKSLSSSDAGARTSDGGESAADGGASSLAPHIYYFNWANFSVENKLANRNGILLGTMQVIFPKATFVHLRGDVAVFAKALREDPSAVVVGFGHHPALDGVGEVSEIPLAYSRLAVMTHRSNPWRYKGPESLAGLRIVSHEDFCDYPLVKRIIKEQATGGTNGIPSIKILPNSRSREDLAKIVEAGEADAFFATCDNAALMPEQISSTILQRFRMSDEIDRGDVLLRVSDRDPDFAKAILSEYAEGMRKIDANGVRRRLFDYYGFTPEPLPAEGEGEK